MIEGQLFVEGSALYISVHGVKHHVAIGTAMEVRIGSVWIPGRFEMNRDHGMVELIFVTDGGAPGMRTGLLARLDRL